MPEARELSVIWDLDGTVLETQSLIPQSLREYGAARGLDFSEVPWLGVGLAEVCEHVRGRFGLVLGVEDLRPFMHARQVELLGELAAQDAAHPAGFGGFVNDLFLQHVPFGLATLSPRDRAMKLLGAAGSAELFPQELMACAQDVENPKPAPDAFQLVARRMWALNPDRHPTQDPATAVVIGDSPEDMAGARAAGMRAVGRVHAYNDADALLASGAAFLVEDYRQLGVECLERLVADGE